MESTRGRPAGGSGTSPESPTAITVSAYVVLVLLGMLEGLVGTFHYSNGPGALLAILFALAILATCVLGAYGMRTALGGLLPAVGWYVVTLLLSTGTSGGSVLIADTPQGKWYLFGGAVCAAAGAVYGYVQWSRASRERREGLPAGQGQGGATRSGQLGAGSSGHGAGRQGAAGQRTGREGLPGPGARPGTAGGTGRADGTGQPESGLRGAWRAARRSSR